MVSNPLSALASLQDGDGCFPSEVASGSRRWRDDNGFTAGLVLRTLRGLVGDARFEPTRQRALDYLDGCRSAEVAGAFGFWPAGRRPPWASRLGADLDDTAVMTMELLRAGRMDRRSALEIACRTLIPHRVHVTEAHPEWLRRGAFLTWVAPRNVANVVDCCVNANVLALLARLGSPHLPGYREAVETICAGLEWAGDNRARVRSLSPFYPSGHDLREAVGHAVECGVIGLAGCHEHLCRLMGAGPPRDDRACCTSAYGATVWLCDGVALARDLISRI